MPKASSNSIVTVSAPKIRAVKVRIVGTAPYMQARFSEKAMAAMASRMTGEVKAGSKKARTARDFDDDYRQAMHISTDGWIGIPSPSLRAAMISACRLVGYQMTRAKLSIFIPAESFDKVDGQGLFQIYGEPEPNQMAVRNATGVFDLRTRPMWRQWYATPTIQWDEDQFSLTDILNLLRRVGLQVGLGEGRPDSRSSAGLGMGTFTVEADASEESVR